MTLDFATIMNLEFLAHVEHQQPEWFIDIGPGVPNSEAWLASQIWPDVQILGLEPCTERYNACLEHEFPGTLLKLAAWSHDEADLPFFADEAKSLWGMFAPDGTPQIEQVAGRSLDSLDDDIGPFGPCVIWADIEGSELRMLQGASGLLHAGSVLALNLEVRPQPEATGWCVEDDVDEFLESHGYMRARDYPQRGRGHHYDVVYVPRHGS